MMSEEKEYEKREVLVKFMSPGSRLAGDTYDEQGNKVKSYNEPFSKKEIDSLKSKGIEKLYYAKEQPKVEVNEEVVTEEKIETEVVVKSSIEKRELLSDAPDFLCDIEKRTKVLLCNFSQERIDFFIPRIIANGIAIYIATSVDQANLTLQRYQITHLLIDIDFDGSSWLSFAEQSKEKDNKLFLFFFYGRTTQKMIDQFPNKEWVNETYDKNLDKKEIVKKIIDDVNLTDSYYSQRKHLKILIKEEDHIKVDIYLSEEQVVTGEGYSISPLEIAFSLTEALKGEIYNFSVGDKLERVGLAILGKVILTKGEVIQIDSDLRRITMKFTHRSELLLSSIGKIIIDKLKKIA